MVSNNDFLKIVITAPLPVDNEALKIQKLLENGIDYIHIRKPDASTRMVRNLIEEIPYEYRNRLRLHGHFDLVNDYNIAGVHLNKRCPVAPRNALSVTKSCHTLQEANNSEAFLYVTLSPVFNSISKTDYNSKFDLEHIKRNLHAKNVIALGGIIPKYFDALKKSGFAGAAMLGCVWNNFQEFIQYLEKNDDSRLL